MIDGKFVANPTVQEMAQSKLDLIYAGLPDKVIMIEGEAEFVSEEEMKKKVEEVYKLKLPSENMDLGDVVNKMDKGEDGTFMGRKLATMRLPTRKIEEIKDPLKRAELMNQNRIKNEAYEISKRSENIAVLYKFLALI
jgi:polyribonucleotide nucleotidyltransferase